MRAAINFGLQLREEQNQSELDGASGGGGGGGEGHAALLEEVKLMKASKAQLKEEVEQIKVDMKEMMELVKTLSQRRAQTISISSPGKAGALAPLQTPASNSPITMVENIRQINGASAPGAESDSPMQ